LAARLLVDLAGVFKLIAPLLIAVLLGACGPQLVPGQDEQHDTPGLAAGDVAGLDSGTPDAGDGRLPGAGELDGGTQDSGVLDAGAQDSGTLVQPPCVPGSDPACSP